MSKTMEPDLQSPLGGEAARPEWRHPSDHWLRGFVIERPKRVWSLRFVGRAEAQDIFRRTLDR